MPLIFDGKSTNEKPRKNKALKRMKKTGHF